MESISVSLLIEPSILENIFITALEGGSNYWLGIQFEDLQKIQQLYSSEGVKTPSSVAIFRAVMQKGVEIPIFDIEENDLLGTISKQNIINGLQKLINDENYQYSLFNEIAGDGDADTSDACMQYFVLGEVIFG
jgi:hypothetical protein